MSVLQVEGKNVSVSNLDKLFWSELNLTKGDMIDYYIRISPYLLPYIKGRPFSMKPYPQGISGESFYQKECPREAPPWLSRTPIPSKRKGVVNWCVINDLPSLIWIANRACIEMHTWFSRLPHLDKPPVAVIDLDPSGNTGFRQAAETALLYKPILDQLGLQSFPKTSGATGIHIYIPIAPKYSFDQVRQFLAQLNPLVVEARPDLTTTERRVNQRGDRIYLDTAQNGSNKTIPAPYSLRPTAQATVSTPLTWSEVANPQLMPEDFTFQNIFQRLDELGDLFRPVLELEQKLPVL
ncbi:bifunctional non-homologous end joining protein LigD [Desulfitispora alkaliphila]|uniref:non-homologous end-joining DNA ligase n=1 Tax=Desulfitispora alkaliphila TaxID=622674 RepID=UPI003D2139EA